MQNKERSAVKIQINNNNNIHIIVSIGHDAAVGLKEYCVFFGNFQSLQFVCWQRKSAVRLRGMVARARPMLPGTTTQNKNAVSMAPASVIVLKMSTDTCRRTSACTTAYRKMKEVRNR